VLIHGAAGGVGDLAVQLARTRGADVIGTASTGNVQTALELGANQVIDHTMARFEDAIDAVDLVFDTAGGGRLERSPAVLRAGGRLVSVAGQPPSTRPSLRSAPSTSSSNQTATSSPTLPSLPTMASCGRRSTRSSHSPTPARHLRETCATTGAARSSSASPTRRERRPAKRCAGRPGLGRRHPAWGSCWSTCQTSPQRLVCA
jgi:Zinc-binding dehydrogenase